MNGAGGTLVVPTFAHGFPKGEPFDLVNTPSEMGILRVCESIACRVEFVHRFDKISESLAFEKYRIEPT